MSKNQELSDFVAYMQGRLEFMRHDNNNRGGTTSYIQGQCDELEGLIYEANVRIKNRKEREKP